MFIPVAKTFFEGDNDIQWIPDWSSGMIDAEWVGSITSNDRNGGLNEIQSNLIMIKQIR